MDPIEIALAADQAAQQTAGVVGKPTVINLCEYGINIYEVMFNALYSDMTEGVFEIDDDTTEFWNKLPSDASPLILVTDTGDGQPIIVDRSPVTSIPTGGGTCAMVASHVVGLYDNSIGIMDFWMQLTKVFTNGVFDGRTRVVFRFIITPTPTETLPL